MEINRISSGDWQRFKKIRLAALQDAPDAFGSTLEQARQLKDVDWRERIEQLPTYLAIVDEVDVGMARVAPDTLEPSEAFLIGMWVAPGARGRGVGEQLVQAVAQWARVAGFTRLLLDVADKNTPAIGLYERMNFQPTGETGSLPPPRTHMLEHRRALIL